MSLSNYSENLLLNYLLNASAVTRPAAWYAQLHMTDPTDTGAAGTQPAIITNDYDRKVVAFSTSTAGTSNNTGAVSWTAAATAATYIFTHVSIWDALTAGNCLFVGTLAVSETVAANGVITFSTAKLVTVLD